MLDGLLRAEPDPDVLLTVRVILAGTSSLHGRLNADPERFVNEIRSLATERGGDRLWVEKVEFQLRPPSTVTVPDGPIEELLDVLEQFRGDPGSLRGVVDELADLRRKLPAGVPPRPRQPATGRGGVAGDPAGPGPAPAPGPAPEIPGRRRQRPRRNLT